MRGPRFYAVPHEEPPHLLTVIEDAVGLPKPALWFRTEERAVKFAESKAGRTALITLLEKAKDGIEGKTGTRVHQ